MRVHLTTEKFSLKACLHLIRFNALPNLVSEPVPGEAH